MEGIWGYDKDQVALVIPDPTNFGSQMLVILGTLTINQIINVIKESEIDELSIFTEWVKNIQFVGFSLRRAHH